MAGGHVRREGVALGGGAKYTTWFRIVFDQPFVAKGIWDDRGGWANLDGPSQQG